MSRNKPIGEKTNNILVERSSHTQKKLHLLNRSAKAEKFVFSSNYGIECHGFIQIIFIVSGSGKLVMNELEHHIKQGMICILEEGSTLDIFPASPVSLYSCTFVPELFGYAAKTFTLADIKDDPSLNFFFDNDIGNRIAPKIPRMKTEAFSKLFNDMIIESDIYSQAHRHIMRIWVSELLIRIAEILGADKVTDDVVSDSQLIQLITSFIKNNYAAKHTYDSLARMACVSRSKLFSSFKKVTGKTIGKYIEGVRLDRACVLLSDSDATVLDIMLETGYNDMKMFCKRFKEYKGMTPTEYRRLHQETTFTNTNLIKPY